MTTAKNISPSSNVRLGTLDDRLTGVDEWLLTSGIQSNDGGVYAWRDNDRQVFSYLYSEITGYAITTFVFLYTCTHDARYLASARLAAQWIMEKALHPCGGVLTRNYVDAAIRNEHYTFERGTIYAFDCAIVAFGFLSLYTVTKEEKYLTAGCTIVRFLTTTMYKDNGLFYPIYDAQKKAPVENTDKWSTQSGSFHCKLALPLCALAAIDGDDQYTQIAERLIEASIRAFYRDGRFITNTSDQSSHLHPYAYTLEGMLYYTHLTGRETFAVCIRDAFAYIARHQEPDGGFPTRILPDAAQTVLHERCDIQAQMLRLSYLLDNPLDRPRLIERLGTFQEKINGTTYGGFIFGTDADGSPKRHTNSWCSMFALQALFLAASRTTTDMATRYLI